MLPTFVPQVDHIRWRAAPVGRAMGQFTDWFL